MPAAQTAYLVIHIFAWYNDEYYDDFTQDSSMAHPRGLFTSQAEAEAYVQQLTRDSLRGAQYHELQLDEDGSDAWFSLAENDDPDLADVLTEFRERPDALPGHLTDEQAEKIMKLLNPQLYHILEADLPASDVQHAQELLAATPHHPAYTPDSKAENPEENPDYGGNEAAERLDRVTQLFGRRYATDLGY